MSASGKATTEHGCEPDGRRFEHLTLTPEVLRLLIPCQRRPRGQGGGARHPALHAYALPKILARRLALAGIKAAGRERLSLHGLRASFITEAYKAGAQ